ncbi:response regulator transcription factor [Marinococcus halophilus]|uniref:Heme response regulator HssR n=1 Tax=Marinococcus halophilus TaxID=1371 RepID=A0A510Y966_MARHA|nr:response regulator transcription factor [Marinococcus halophilus]GEK59914.1 DNA-binding response regulator [Marinococcus halophilus]
MAILTILLVDDDPNILAFTGDYLRRENYRVYEASHAEEAWAILDEHDVHIALVDVMMPGTNGFELTTIIRQDYDIPVILLTAKNQIEDKEQGYASGTDDYITKPFESKELLFRLRAVLRRYQQVAQERIQVGRTRINTKTYEVSIGHRALLLPLKEFELLVQLASYPKRTYSREELIESIWGSTFEGDERTVDVHVKRLRERFRRLDPGFDIQTVRGIGYRLEVIE